MSKSKRKPFRVSSVTTGASSRYFDDVRAAARAASEMGKSRGVAALFKGRTPLMHCYGAQKKPGPWQKRHSKCVLTAAGKRLLLKR